jgi:hypothetical protein
MDKRVHDDKGVDHMVQLNMRIPKGARDYLLQMAIEHDCYVMKKGTRHPSIQILLRYMAAGVIKTIKNYDVLDIDNMPTYPHSRGKAGVKEALIKKTEDSVYEENYKQVN